MADGAVVRARTKETLSYGTLTKGRKLTKTVSSQAPTTPADRWTVAGHSVPKVDGRSFVTGEHKYASDVRLPGMWHGKVLRPPSYGAKLTSLDAGAAKAMPDVIVVRDGDFVGVARAQRSHGDPGTGRAQGGMEARAADLEQGPLQGAEATRTARPGRARGGGGFGGSNGRSGSIADGLKVADVRLEQSYTIAYIAHAPLEPRAAVAQWENGKLTVWTGIPGTVPGARRADRGLRIVRRRRTRHRARHRLRLRGQAHGRSGRRGGAAGREAGRPVKVVWTRKKNLPGPTSAPRASSTSSAA